MDYIKGFDRILKRGLGVNAKANRPKSLTQSVYQKPTVNSVNNLSSQFILESPKETPVLTKCDILVVGAGPAGISAALAAARAGADTILLDRYGAFGGVITNVGMESIGWYRYEGCVEGYGIGLEMERQAARMGATSKWAFNDSECLDAEHFKYVADCLIKASKVRPLLYCLAVDVLTQQNKIVGIIIESKSGRQAVLADRVIDCTGDADIAYHCGVPFTKADKNDRLGVSMVFSASNVNKDSFLEYVQHNPKTYQDWSDDWQISCHGKEKTLSSPYIGKEFSDNDWQIDLPSHLSIGGTWSSITDIGEAKNLNLVYMKNYDGLDICDLTNATIEGRLHCLNALDALKKNIPGFENAVLRSFSSTLGVRDTRKIFGQYNLTHHDVLHEARFADSVGIFPEFLDGYNTLVLPTTGRYFQIPYRCLIPQNIENLLVAGRAVAGDQISHAAMRNMMACTVTGQAAGIAAAVSMKTKTSVSKSPIDKIQAELMRQRVRYL